MNNNAIKQLRKFVISLRDKEEGCAWTRSQTFQSLAPQTLEECYELMESIQQSDYPAIKDELSDLLYHLTFYATIAEENNLFTLDDLAEHTLDKHQHRMPDKITRKNMTADEVNDFWQAKKQKQRQAQQESEQTIFQQSQTLKNIPITLPALSRALKIQKKAAKVGFDWPNRALIFEKLEEEIEELRDAINNNDQNNILEEIGDILFTCVNLSRHLNIDPEQALRHSNEKFIKRFTECEKNMKKDNKNMESLNIEELEKYWEKSK